MACGVEMEVAKEEMLGFLRGMLFCREQSKSSLS